MEKIINSKKYAKLITLLRQARENQDLSMMDLGEKLGESHQLVYRVESIERRLDVLEFVQYCNALDIDPLEAFETLL